MKLIVNDVVVFETNALVDSLDISSYNGVDTLHLPALYQDVTIIVRPKAMSLSPLDAVGTEFYVKPGEMTEKIAKAFEVLMDPTPIQTEDVITVDEKTKEETTTTVVVESDDLIEARKTVLDRKSEPEPEIVEAVSLDGKNGKTVEVVVEEIKTTSEKTSTKNGK